MKTIFIAILLIQLISLQNATNTFSLSFQFAARQGLPLGTSLADVLWNDVIILSIVPPDYFLHIVSVNVIAVVGANTLQFEGAGISDSYGLEFTNVKLRRIDDVNHTNLIINGNFSQPAQYGSWSITNDGILGWVGIQIEIGAGVIYSSVWPSGLQVCELDANYNVQISQTLTFDSNFQLISNIVPVLDIPCSPSLTLGSYTLEFDWAPTTSGAGAGNLATSQANVLWNNVVIASLVPSFSGISHSSFQLVPNSCIDNVLQFDGASTSDGIGLTISNIKFYSTSNVNQTTFPTFINGNFQTPIVSINSYEIGESIPGWIVSDGQIGDCNIYNSQWTAARCISLDSSFNQRYTQKFPMVASQIGIDLEGPLNPVAFGCLVLQDYTWSIVRADVNFAVQTLQNAQTGGLSTDIYMVLCRGIDPIAQVQAVLGNIPSNLYSKLWLKAVPNSHVGCSWTGYNYTDNCNFLTSALTVITQNGKDAGVFTTPYIWNEFFGSACNSIGSAGFDLWYAHYLQTGHVNSTLSFSDFVSFGGWSEPSMKQTGGNITVTLCNNPLWHAYLDLAWHP